MEITNGKNKRAQKVVVYGTEGVGKSTFASKFPQVIFSDVEGSTDELDVARLPKPSSWEMLLQQAKWLKDNPDKCRTWVIDTADWAENLCADHICAKSKKEGIEDFGYGRGYVYLEEEFGRLLNLCSELLDVGINVVFTAHAHMKKVEQPEEMGSYDRWELKLEKKTAPLLKEWADMVLFVNYKVYVVNVDGQGTQKGKNKAQGGKRVMYTTHTTSWDGKNRHGLPDEVPFEYSQIEHCIPVLPVTSSRATQSVPAQVQEVKFEAPKVTVELVKVDVQPPVVQEQVQIQIETPAPKIETEAPSYSGLPTALADLMKTNNVTPEEIQKAVADKGYYPANTPIAVYDPQFISGVLVAAWPQVFALIQDLRKLPF